MLIAFYMRKEMINLLTVADLTKEDLPMLLGLLGSEEEGRLQNGQESDVGMYTNIC